MILGTFKKSKTDATEIPLGPQRGNWHIHQGGPSPRQPDVVEAGKKFSLPPPGPPTSGEKMLPLKKVVLS